MRYPKKKSYLVNYLNGAGNQVQILFTKKISAYRFASRMRASLFEQGLENTVVETKEISVEEVRSLTGVKG
jgi:hypothetical protein